MVNATGPPQQGQHGHVLRQSAITSACARPQDNKRWTARKRSGAEVGCAHRGARAHPLRTRGAYPGRSGLVACVGRA